jgi:hypothetical protein
MAEGLPEIVIGAIIAGLVGLVTVWAQQRLQKRQWVKDNVLAPMYNFVVGLTEHPNRWSGQNPWRGVAWSDRMKVPRRTAEAIKRFSDAWEDYRQADVEYSNYIEGDVREELLGGFTAALSKHLDSQGRLPMGPFGETGGRAVEVTWLFDWAHRLLIRHMDDPDLAWKELEGVDDRQGARVGRIFRTLRHNHPETLDRIHSKLRSRGAVERAQKLLRVADDKQSVVVYEAQNLRRLLQRKLT